MTTTLDPRLVAAIKQLAARATPGRPLLVASDFDGVLAPLGDDPSASRPTPAAAAALERLAAAPASRARLALVSGRTLESLGALSGAPLGTLLIGSHGAERGEVVATPPDGVPGVEHRPFALSEAEAALLDQVRTGLEGVATGVEGAWVEHKPSAAVLHTRLASTEEGAQAADAAHTVGTALGAHTMRGKDVVEVAVVATSKGQALTALRREPRPSSTWATTSPTSAPSRSWDPTTSRSRWAPGTPPHGSGSPVPTPLRRCSPSSPRSSSPRAPARPGPSVTTRSQSRRPPAFVWQDESWLTPSLVGAVSATTLLTPFTTDRPARTCR